MPPPPDGLVRPGTRSWQRVPVALPVATAALSWRVWLTGRYAGWEESDYGNLAMVRGVLDGGFLHYDMNHMPGYYALGALVLAVLDDTVVAARGVSLVGGVVAAALATWAAERHAGRAVACLAGLFLIVQPEFALYASSSLREPVYAAFVVGCLLALGRERLVLAGALAGAAFLVRFDAALALGPVLVLHAMGRRPRAVRLAQALVPLGLIIGAWSLYCRVDHGTFRFWSHAVQVNVETGLGAEHDGGFARAANGVRVAGTLVAWLLPWRIGWGMWLGVIAALSLAPWTRHDARRTWALAAVLLTGVWAGIGFVGQHEPSHNLYWKWMAPLVPVLLPLGAAAVIGGARALAARVGRGVSTVLLLGVVGQGVASNLKETRRQLDQSDAWYRPQLELAQWIEAEVDPEIPLLVDNIPACWIDRRPHERRLTSWFDVPSTPGDAASFARWLRVEEIGWVLWFREDWTQAPGVAPFLADGGVWSGPGVRLTETRREDGYGWILFRVDRVDGVH